MPGGWYISGYSFTPDHPAYDIAPDPRNSHYGCALKPGVVLHSGPDTRTILAEHPEWDRGLYVELEHDDGSRSRYCHAARLTVIQSETVLGGQPLGVMGETGAARGKHWHIAMVDKDGVPVDWITEAGWAT